MTSGAPNAEVERFEFYYLQKETPVDTMPSDWSTFKKKMMKEMTGKEKGALSALVSAQCLVFCNTRDTGCKGEFDGSRLKPDISCVISTRKQAKKVVRDGKLSGPVHWNRLVSLGEVKCKTAHDGDGQTISCLQVLPRARPDLTGMLYISWETLCFRLHWSDTSGIISSQPYWLSTETRKVLFASSAHGRQTCVFLDQAAERAIKDHWRDMRRRSKESAILEKIKGVPGVVQVDFSETVMMVCEKKEIPLRTRDVHFGKDAIKEDNGFTRPAPLREKQRSVLKTTGDSLGRRTTVRQLLMVLYDGIEGHQLCLIEKRVLHRDVSQNNIIINPVHHDTKLDDYPDAKFINRVIDPSVMEVKEEGVLIDWDNATNLDELTEANCLTKRTGTPMFVARAVANGRVTRNLDERPEFPEISDRARELYSKAYGSEKYELYRNAINSAPGLQRVSLWEDIVVEHCGHHDVESFFWVLVFQLLHA
ncbi:hypothetical protein M0805_007656 [Coniferiporia weirii]|nr:hypothetical protein M0805_007656 [Coniferiporia weirii]